MNYDEMIAVIQAAKEGKVIQCRPRLGGEWVDEISSAWNFYTFDYRVKPEPPKPREWWVAQYDIGGTSLIKEVSVLHPTRESCERISAGNKGFDRAVHVREVLEGQE